jgi:hypothetical protein
MMACKQLALPQFEDPHQKIGLSLFIMYIIQVIIGIFVHYVKVPTLGRGRRPVQNYLHALLGLAIMALAAYQVRGDFVMLTEF